MLRLPSQQVYTTANNMILTILLSQRSHSLFGNVLHMYQNRRQSAPNTHMNNPSHSPLGCNSLAVSPSNHRKLSPTNSLKNYGQSTPRSRSPYNLSPRGSLRGNRPGLGNSLHVSPPNSIGFSPVGGAPTRFPSRPVNGVPNKYR